jgi:hypothetical protein
MKICITQNTAVANGRQRFAYPNDVCTWPVAVDYSTKFAQQPAFYRQGFSKLTDLDSISTRETILRIQARERVTVHTQKIMAIQHGTPSVRAKFVANGRGIAKST